MSSPVPTFELHALLGRGGMGEVHLATMKLGAGRQTVALKRMRIELAQTPEGLRQFEREAKICSLLDHENIIALRAFGKDTLGPYLALEYVEGKSASQLLLAYERFAEVLPPQAIFQIALDVARGLNAAHQSEKESAQGVIHRDLSPDNLLVAFSGICKVGDFGIAKLAGTTSFTTTGTMKGKFAYMAPELFDGHEADKSTDHFALAATLYQLWCGVKPFRGRTEAELMRAVLSAEPVPLNTLRAGMPPEVSDWIHAALQKDRARRPAGLPPLIAALARAVQEGEGRPTVAKCMLLAFPTREAVTQPESTLPGATASLIAPRPRRRRWPTVAAGAGALAVLGATLGVLTSRSAAPPIEVEVTAPVPVPVKVTLPSLPPAAAVEPPAVRGPPSSTRGSLRVKVKPWGQVFVDGRLQGVTPLAPMSLSSGTHQVIVVNEKLKDQKTYSVEVQAGKMTELKVVFVEKRQP